MCIVFFFVFCVLRVFQLWVCVLCECVLCLFCVRGLYVFLGVVVVCFVYCVLRV